MPGCCDIVRMTLDLRGEGYHFVVVEGLFSKPVGRRDRTHDSCCARAQSHTHRDLIVDSQVESELLAPALQDPFHTDGNQVIFIRGNSVGVYALIPHIDDKIGPSRDVDIEIKPKGKRRAVKGASEVGAGGGNTD